MNCKNCGHTKNWHYEDTKVCGHFTVNRLKKIPDCNCEKFEEYK